LARPTTYRGQHAEILRLASELQATPTEQQLAADASPARTLLSRLLGKRSLHLAREERYLYPELQGAQGASMAALAKRFDTEMGGIATQVNAWGKRWATPGMIKADPRQFIIESDGILDTLRKRMHREDVALYAAADAM
jgi:hypothetical protein